MGRCFRLVPLLAAAAAQNHGGNFQGKHDAVGAIMLLAQIVGSIRAHELRLRIWCGFV